jgi:hypothetical protein
MSDQGVRIMRFSDSERALSNCSQLAIGYLFKGCLFRGLLRLDADDS